MRVWVHSQCRSYPRELHGHSESHNSLVAYRGAWFLAATLLVCGCGGGNQLPPPPTFRATERDVPFTPLQTYDHDGQVVEPDVIYVPGGWNGFTYWMTAAPYPFEDARDENASIWATNDPPGQNMNWIVPPGVSNPVIPFAPKGWHNQDQSIFLDSDGTMYLYYVVSSPPMAQGGTAFAKGAKPTVMVPPETVNVDVVFSKDGWKTVQGPIQLMSLDSNVSHPLVCFVLKDPARPLYYMWYTDIANEPHVFVRQSSSSPVGPFGDPQFCTIYNIPPNRDLWEENITWSAEGKYLFALITLATPATGGADTTLHFMYSTDLGLTWNLGPGHVVDIRKSPNWDTKQIYRGCLVPDPATLAGTGKTYHVWYSADDLRSRWHIGHAEGFPAIPIAPNLPN